MTATRYGLVAATSQPRDLIAATNDDQPSTKPEMVVRSESEKGASPEE
tara:strand:- start:213 stop:356 length:144 start_codon:yes stop_codon:yes gene_type:complete